MKCYTAETRENVMFSRYHMGMSREVQKQRTQAHALLDQLPPEKVAAVRTLLEAMVEPLSGSLALAPLEEEEISSETGAALKRSRASLARGEKISHEEILREFEHE